VIRPKIELELSLDGVISSEQCRAARGFLKWSQAEAAMKLGVGLSLLVTFENGRRPQARNLGRIKAAFERAGIDFAAAGCRLVVAMDVRNSMPTIETMDSGLV
jgi:transcriptional regulator with XRE-family HTH domain